MSDGPRPFILAETNWKSVKETGFDLAVLPWGATEAHNYHLPYATDNYQVDFVCEKAATLAWENDARAIVLPCVPFGVNTGQFDISLCINMSPSTQLAILKDIALVLECCGIEKLVIANGHGGNHFKQMIRELSSLHPELFCCAINWYEAGDFNKHFEQEGDHAGELETSCMMHIRPDLCLPLGEAGFGKAKVFRAKAFKQGWATAQREWSQVTEDTGVGDPSASNAEKGKAYLEECAKNIAEFFIELAESDLDDMYEDA